MKSVTYYVHVTQPFPAKKQDTTQTHDFISIAHLCSVPTTYNLQRDIQYLVSWIKKFISNPIIHWPQA